MTEISKIVLTAGLTIFGGIIVLVVGRLTEHFLIEPVHQLRRAIGDTAHALIFYASQYSNPGTGAHEVMTRASDHLRDLASTLRSTAQVLPLYGLCHRVGLLPRRSNVKQASRELIGLSNGVHQGKPEINHDRRAKIQLLLGIEDSSAD